MDGLLTHPDVRSISFVGSTPIARHVYETGTATGKRVQALGGAKNHAVVLPDADLDLAADQAVNAGFGSAGERCMAISAVVAVGSAGDTLVEKIRERAEGLQVVLLRLEGVDRELDDRDVGLGEDVREHRPGARTWCSGSPRGRSSGCRGR